MRGPGEGLDGREEVQRRHGPRDILHCHPGERDGGGAYRPGARIGGLCPAPSRPGCGAHNELGAPRRSTLRAGHSRSRGLGPCGSCVIGDHAALRQFTGPSIAAPAAAVVTDSATWPGAWHERMLIRDRRFSTTLNGVIATVELARSHDLYLHLTFLDGNGIND